MTALRELYERIGSDSFRTRQSFSAEILEAQIPLLQAADFESRSKILGLWLSKHQPCLFGKIAARQGMLQYCFLTEADLQRPDDQIRDLIADSHRRWWSDALLGRKSGFVVLAISQRLAVAAPDMSLLAFSQRLCELYLQVDRVEPDQIYLDQAFLEIPDRPQTHLFRWDAGVNVFAAAGDGRWWQDHRVPGGIGFSVNSVGHMVKSAESNRAVGDLRSAMAVEVVDDYVGPVDSLGKALELAMGTIANAAETQFGRATWLIPSTDATAQGGPPCPVELGKKLAGHWHCAYRGTYHTDVTLPGVYFRPDVQRPAETNAMLLDFTYLFNDSADNPAHSTMGRGQQVRVNDDVGEGAPIRTNPKYGRQWPTIVSASDFPQIKAILGSRKP